MVKRPNAWRERSLDDIQKKLDREKADFVYGKITGIIKEPDKKELDVARRFLQKFLKRLKRKNVKTNLGITWHDTTLLKRKIKRLERKVRRIENGSFKKTSRKSEEEQHQSN